MENVRIILTLEDVIGLIFVGVILLIGVVVVFIRSLKRFMDVLKNEKFKK